MAGKSPVKVFHCPQCGASVVLRAMGRSLSVACGSCGSVIDPTNENYRIISRFNQEISKSTPAIPLGTRGTLRGDPWEIIGYLTRSTQGIDHWREYLLFNPYKGYRWLTEYDGHWTFVSMIKDRPIPSSGSAINYMGKIFHPFQAGLAKVEFVVGEFYWRVKVGEQVQFQDYISPPEMLSLEQYESEKIWSLGEYETPEIISAAFSVADLPHRSGIGACQPFPHLETLSFFWNVGAGFVVVLVIIHLFSGNGILGNLVVCSFLVLTPPLILRYYYRHYELTRWGDESDLSQISTWFGRDNR